MLKIELTIDINESAYLKNPLETSLGNSIITSSIKLISTVGFEKFTFKKLADIIDSTEASVYRYFKNKYQLLAYLVAWYWDFMHFMILLDTRNAKDARQKLKQAIMTLVTTRNNVMTPVYIEHNLLHKVVLENATKVYHNADVDALNKDGYYINYKKIIQTLSSMIIEIDKTFKYPTALATNIVEHSLNNEYYLDHLPDLTDKKKQGVSSRQATVNMIDYFLDRLL